MESSREATQKDTDSKGQTTGPVEPLEKGPVPVGISGGFPEERKDMVGGPPRPDEQALVVRLGGRRIG